MMMFTLKFVKEADYQRALEVAERFNEDNPKLPIKLTLVGARIEVEASAETPAKGAWYIDATSASPGRLQFFMDEMQRLEQDARKLDRYLRLPPETSETALETTIPVSRAGSTSKKKPKPKTAPEEFQDPFLAAMADAFTGTAAETPPPVKKGRKRNVSAQEGDQQAS